MRLRFTYVRGGKPVDLEVDVEASAAVRDVAAALVRRDPLRTYARSTPVTLAVGPTGSQVVLSPDEPVGDSLLASGSTVGVVDAGGAASPQAAPAGEGVAAVLRVLEGPDAAREFPLAVGATTVGRSAGSGVRLSDPLVSKLHARIHVGATVEIIDNGSANGVELDGATVARATLRPADRVTLGDTVIQVELTHATAQDRVLLTTTSRTFVRPPRVVEPFAPEGHPAPEVPGSPQPQRFPLIALVTPVVLGAGLYFVTGSLASLLFVALSPLMMVGQWVESRWSGRRQHRQAVQQFHADLDELRALVRARQDEERTARLRQHPSTAELADAIRSRSDLLWSRRPDVDGFLAVRLGVGSLPSLVTVEDGAGGGRGERRLREEVLSVRADLAAVDGVPVVADLRECRALGVGGAGENGAAVARALVLQLAAAHSPAELVIAACVGSTTSDRWSWLVWLPHTDGAHSPIDVDLLSSGVVGSTALLTSIEALVVDRVAASTASVPLREPALVLVVEDDAVVDRARLVALAEAGAGVGVHILWVAPSRTRLPAACRAYVAIAEDGGAEAGFVDAGLRVAPLAQEVFAAAEAMACARSLAPVTDAGALVDDSGDLPRSVAYLSLAGAAMADEPDEVVERWVETDSVAARRAPGRRRAAGSLRALVGQDATGPLHLDLRSQGPHALVGGTTGAGKSELLQSWVLGMAAAHSPERVTFLFVDYKGGSAFGECVQLPHSVGLVTDLSPHLVRRALVSLSAELKHREHVLNAAGAKDLAEMEREGRPEAPPSLVIVVDEFAALAHDVPEFVDGVVNIAQRGRSLGLHLILATQRPAGVIKDNLRANTNLRLALRMADAADSTDVLGVDMAASFDPAIPGRAAVRSGPGTPTVFQAAYSGGWTGLGPSGPDVAVRELSLSGAVAWEEPPAAIPVHADGPTDLERLVGSVQEAARRIDLAPVRRPWLPELASLYELADLPSSRRDEHLVLGVSDHPGDQAQPVFSFDPDRDGNLLVVGTGGAGKSTVLRTLAAAAGFTVRGGPVHVYGLDFGSRGLQMLEVLPHVGSIVAGDDNERVVRLLRWLRQEVDDRSRRYSAVKASTITDYRGLAGRPDEPRLLLLLDGLAGFRQAHDVGSVGGLLEIVTGIATDGRQVGVHVVVSADRLATVPSSLASMLPRRLALRAADDSELALMGVPKDVLGPQAPPGRGWLDGAEVQVGVLGGTTSLADQASSMERLGEAIARHSQWPAAAEIRRLPEQIALSSLPSEIGAGIVIGVEDESLSSFAIPADGTFVVTGPPGSGRTSALATIVSAARRRDPGLKAVLVTPSRSRLAELGDWHIVATGEADAAQAAEDLLASLGEVADARWLLVVEGAQEFVNSAADLPLQDLVRSMRALGHLIVAEGDTQPLAGSWPLPQALRFSRRGIVLQPDQSDGDLLFRTSFPRVRRTDFPVGRGLLVREGRVVKVQLARA